MQTFSSTTALKFGAQKFPEKTFGEKLDGINFKICLGRYSLYSIDMINAYRDADHFFANF